MIRYIVMGWDEMEDPIMGASEKRACRGAATVSCRMSTEHAQRCRHCGTKVRDDMVDHRFFGFAAGCDQAERRSPTDTEARDGA